MDKYINPFEDVHLKVKAAKDRLRENTERDAAFRERTIAADVAAEAPIRVPPMPASPVVVVPDVAAEVLDPVGVASDGAAVAPDAAADNEDEEKA